MPDWVTAPTASETHSSTRGALEAGVALVAENDLEASFWLGPLVRNVERLTDVPNGEAELGHFRSRTIGTPLPLQRLSRQWPEPAASSA